MGLGIRSKLRSLSHLVLGGDSAPAQRSPAPSQAPPPRPAPPSPAAARFEDRASSTTPSVSSRTDEEARRFVEEQIGKERLVIFMKGTAAEPRCGFSAAAVDLALGTGVKFHTVDVIEEPGVRDAVKAFTSWPTIPQVFIDGRFVGGSDIFREMWESGEVKRMLAGGTSA